MVLGVVVANRPGDHCVECPTDFCHLVENYSAALGLGGNKILRSAILGCGTKKQLTCLCNNLIVQCTPIV